MAPVVESRWRLGYDGEDDLEMRFSCLYHWQAAFMPNSYYRFDLLLLYCFKCYIGVDIA